ncbi:MAG: hypothetical protein R2762_11720 [Bryobacteraceae bacterium]
MPTVSAPRLAAADTFLKIEILEGEGAFHDTKRRVGSDIAVVVKNERGDAVSNAEVIFTVPSFGAGGAYADGSNSFKALTDDQGRARSMGFKPNQLDGRFNVKVTASSPGRQGQVVVSQTNSRAVKAIAAPGAGGGGKSKLILGLVGTGATVGLLVSRFVGGGNSTNTPSRPPTTLSVGGISVGGPR